MSLDIALIDENGEEVAEMNWLRNPFGLCNWVEDNATESGHKPKKERTLWHVVNHWNYDKSPNVDRKLFLEVVNEYWGVIKELEYGYYFFDLPGYRQFIEGKTHLMPQEETVFGVHIAGEKYAPDGRVMIPMENFSHPEFHLSDPSWERGVKWFSELQVRLFVSTRRRYSKSAYA